MNANTTRLLCAYVFLTICIHCAHNIILESIYQKYLKQGVEFRENFFLGNKPILREYDFVVVGGGTAGSVVANRLSENPHWKVLLLESGEDETIYQDIPLLSHFNSLTGYNWGYKLERETGHEQCLAMHNHQCPCARGKGLGGTSILNYMIYTRGNRKDYDSYAVAGNQGWDYNSVLKYFLKSENNTSEFLDEGVHSTQGPLKVQNIPYPNLLTEKFIQSACELGYPIYDYTGQNPATEGFSKLQSTTSRGQRYSASRAYLKSVKKRTSKNLHVAILSHVTKILVDPKTKKALGVEFRKAGVKRVVYAKKEVVLSAGAINSPQILMLSGIGPKEHLAEFQIEPVMDLPGVGENMNDHHAYFALTFLVNKTNTGSTIENKIVNVDQFLRWLKTGRGPFTVPGGVTAIGYSSSKYNVDKSWPDLEYVFAVASMNSDGGRIFRQSLNVREDIYNSVYRSINNKESWSVLPVLLRPKTRGSIKLKSKNPFKHPKIQYDFFQNEQDEAVMLDAIKNVIKMSETDAFKSIGSRLHNTPIPGCAQHEFGSDEYWKCSMRYFTSSLYHQSGTCKMGTAYDNYAVVDATLQVYGVPNLRVVDASVFPVAPSAHLYAPTIMVAEKASDMIKDKWKNNYEQYTTTTSVQQSSTVSCQQTHNLESVHSRPQVPNQPNFAQSWENQNSTNVPSHTSEIALLKETTPTPLPTTASIFTESPVISASSVYTKNPNWEILQTSTIAPNNPSSSSYQETTKTITFFTGYPSKPISLTHTQNPYSENSEPSTYPPQHPVNNPNGPNQNFQQPLSSQHPIPNGQFSQTNHQTPNTGSVSSPQNLQHQYLSGNGSTTGFQAQQINYEGALNPTQINIFHQGASYGSYLAHEKASHSKPHNRPNSNFHAQNIRYESNQNSGFISRNPYHQTSQYLKQDTSPQDPYNSNDIRRNDILQAPYVEPIQPPQHIHTQDCYKPQLPSHQSYQHLHTLAETVPRETVNNLRPPSSSLFDIPYYNKHSVASQTNNSTDDDDQYRSFIPATIFLNPNDLFPILPTKYFKKRQSKDSNQSKSTSEDEIEIISKDQFQKEVTEGKLSNQIIKNKKRK